MLKLILLSFLVSFSGIYPNTGDDNLGIIKVANNQNQYVFFQVPYTKNPYCRLSYMNSDGKSLWELDAETDTLGMKVLSIYGATEVYYICFENN